MVPNPSLPSKKHCGQYVLLAVVAFGVLGIITGVLVINLLPGTAANSADLLRAVIGDQAVGQLETWVYKAQDSLKQLQYRLPGSQASRENGPTLGQAALVPTNRQSAPTLIPTIVASLPPSSQTPTSFPGTATPTIPPAPTTPPPWSLEPRPALGSLNGEGLWTPYIQDSNGKTVAYRTMLQPDPDRPYAVVAVVAFDLKAVQLHYLLGLDEPASEVKAPRPGIIPPEDKQPGKLLAVFNGGFKAHHGHFGVMTGGTVWLPPKDGMGTLAFYPDGSYKLGVWGQDIDPQAEMLSWRQNGPLVVQNGVVDSRVSSTDPAVWGYTVQEMAPIWRSAIGLSADGRVLYYFAGPSLTLPALARGIADSGAANAIQLDINNYWVHFDAIQADGSRLKTLPLFEYMGRDNDTRYLQVYTRDYFYVTIMP